MIMMEEILTAQNVVNVFAWLVGRLFTLFGIWALRLQAQVDKFIVGLQEYKVYVEINTAKKSDIDRIEGWFHRIYDRLDSKQDK